MSREEQKSLISQASFIPLSVLWNFPGVRPATIDVFCNPTSYLSYINACFSKGSKQLPRLDLEMAVALEKVEAEFALKSESKLDRKNAVINSYMSLVMHNALNDQDTLNDYQIVFEHEKFDTKFSSYTISLIYARILEQALQIGRDANDPRTAYVLDRFFRHITKNNSQLPRCIVILVDVLVKWGLFNANREIITTAITKFEISSKDLIIQNSFFRLTKIFLEMNDIIAISLLLKKVERFDFLEIYLGIAFILMEKGNHTLFLQSNEKSQFFSNLELNKFKELWQKLKNWIEKIKSDMDVDFKFIFDQVKDRKNLNSSIIEDLSLQAKMRRWVVQKYEYSDRLSEFLLSFDVATILDEVFKNPKLVSKFIEYCCQSNSYPAGTDEYFENSDVISKLKFEDRKKLVTVMPFVKTAGITKLISGLSNVQAIQLLRIAAKKSARLWQPGNQQYFDALFIHLFLFESHDPKIDYFVGKEKNEKEKAAEVAVPVILAYANTLTEPTGTLDALTEKDKAALQRLPLALYVAMINKGHHTIPAGFHEFLDRYDKANQYAGEARLIIDYKKFIMENIFKIVNLYDIFGDDLFTLMTNKLATSALKLSKFFDNIQVIPSEYFPLLRAINCINAKNKYDYISSILLKISQCESLIYELGLQNIDASEKSRILLRWEELAKKLNPDLIEIENEITKAVVSLYRKILNIAEDIELDCTKLLEERELIGRLLIGRSHMQANQYSDVFDRLVTEDLRVGGSFQTFSYDITQEDELGKRLATHNQKIIEELNAKTINAEFALNYPMKKIFTTEVDAKIDVIGLCHAVWQDLLNFEDQLKKFESKWEAPIKKIQAQIKKVKAEVEKGKEANPERLKSDGFATLFKKIIGEFNDLARLENIGNIAPGIIEHGTHFKQRVQTLDAAKKIKDRTKKMPNRTFRVEQWDKSDIDTFVMGDRLSCCLAPDGGQFQAMVQRRMDAAMLMHVVIDEESNQPVCGNWLFFGRDKNNPEYVYVVANFYEIRAGYAEKQELRDKLVSELTEFTANYAKAIGAKGYLIRPLTYGMIPDMNDKCDTIPMSIEKVGGFFDPKEDREPEEILESYYLEALKLTEIHQYRGNAGVPVAVKLGIFQNIPKFSSGHNDRLVHLQTKLEKF